jgi:hypothetical protein
VVLAWLQARDLEENKPHRLEFGSFEAWGDLVAGGVSWLTGENPIDLIEDRKQQEQKAAPDRHAIEALAAWQAGLTDTRGNPRAEWKAEEAASNLDPSIWPSSVRFKGERPTGLQLSSWLRKKRDVVFGDLMLRGTPDTHAKVMWWSLRGLRVSSVVALNSRARFCKKDEESVLPNCVEGVPTTPANTRNPRNDGHRRNPNACIHCGDPCSPSDTANSIPKPDGRWAHLDCELAQP